MIEQRAFTLRILYFALLMSTCIYGAIAFVVCKEPLRLEMMIAYALGGCALVIMGIIPVLRGRVMPPMREAHSLDEKVAETDAVSAALQKYFTACIVSWALCESIAIFGLVLSFLSGEPKYFVPFGALSLVNFAIYRPSREQLLSVARAAV